ncbi:MAG: hypothetical protein LBR08_02320 [Bacteroidales bacterium]|jgi:hypothetical protein|nr:hypothetical protein [Bacteroidales bacterium]
MSSLKQPYSIQNKVNKILLLCVAQATRVALQRKKRVAVIGKRSAACGTAETRHAASLRRRSPVRDGKQYLIKSAAPQKKELPDRRESEFFLNIFFVEYFFQYICPCFYFVNINTYMEQMLYIIAPSFAEHAEQLDNCIYFTPSHIEGNGNPIKFNGTFAARNQPLAARNPNFIARNLNFIARNLNFIARNQNLFARKLIFIARNQNLFARKLNFIARKLNFIARNLNLIARKLIFIARKRTLTASSIHFLKNIINSNYHL